MNFDPTKAVGGSRELFEFAAEHRLDVVNFIYVSDDQTQNPDKQWVAAVAHLPRAGEKIGQPNGEPAIVHQIYHRFSATKLPSGASITILVANVVLRPAPTGITTSPS